MVWLPQGLDDRMIAERAVAAGVHGYALSDYCMIPPATTGPAAFCRRCPAPVRPRNAGAGRVVAGRSVSGMPPVDGPALVLAGAVRRRREWLPRAWWIIRVSALATMKPDHGKDRHQAEDIAIAARLARIGRHDGLQTI